MLVQGYHIEIDVWEELEPYLDYFPLWIEREGKLVSCSPFREDNKPSFVVFLDHGNFVDSGEIDTEYHQGNIVKLLSWLTKSTSDEVEQYLIQKYYFKRDPNQYVLNLNLYVKDGKGVDLKPLLDMYAYRHPYLQNRGVSELVQQHFLVGYDKRSHSVSMPWQSKTGEVINIKFRNVDRKSFFYLQEGSPIKNHLYGLYHVLKYSKEVVVLVESEIDALYLWSNKIPAIAVGGSFLSKQQLNLLLHSPIKEIVLGVDNDDRGRAFHQELKNTLMKYFRVSTLVLPQTCKDVNEVPSDTLVTLFNGRENCGLDLRI